MNNLPDEDPQLTNFLRQHRSIAPPSRSGLEDRLMAEIRFLPIEIEQNLRSRWRYFLITTVLVIAGLTGRFIYQISNPPDVSVAELHQLNLYLEAHADGLYVSPDADIESHSLLDIDLLTDGESEDS